MFYVHKLETAQRYGGPEEGGWWYDRKEPLDEDDVDYEPPIPVADEETAYAVCRGLNQVERERREGLEYGYTSSLSHREVFYAYTVTESRVYEVEPRPVYC